MESLIKLLIKVRKNPDYYLEGKKSLLSLLTLISDYKHKKCFEGKYYTEHSLVNFLRFIYKKYNMSLRRTWYETGDIYEIVTQNSSSEADAYETFYELLDEFITEEEKQMESVFNILFKIRENPALYFGGRENLALLRAFIDGYITRQWETDENFCGTYALNGFQEFVQMRYDIVANQSWDRIIDFYSLTDIEAFETFYRLLNEFLETKKD